MKLEGNLSNMPGKDPKNLCNMCNRAIRYIYRTKSPVDLIRIELSNYLTSILGKTHFSPALRISSKSIDFYQTSNMHLIIIIEYFIKKT